MRKYEYEYRSYVRKCWDNETEPFTYEEWCGKRWLSKPSSNCKFKKGDRVYHVTGGLGIFTGEFQLDGQLKVLFDDDGKVTGCLEKNLSLIPNQPITISGKKYEVLKPISGESIWDGGKYKECKEWRKEFEEFVLCYGMFEDESPFDGFCKTVPNHPKWLSWLIEHGYLKEVKKVVKRKEVLNDVSWTKRENASGYIVPCSNHYNAKIIQSMEGKSNVTMTLEWEEEE